MNKLTCAVASLAFIAHTGVVNAMEILTVNGPAVSEAFTLEELTELPQIAVRTGNDYVDAPATFSGPSLRHLLEHYGINASASLRMRALNDFTVTIPASDAYKYQVILALRKDGELMTVRDKGPIWVIYPMDDHPELADDMYNSRLIWQLAEITVE